MGDMRINFTVVQGVSSLLGALVAGITRGIAGGLTILLAILGLVLLLDGLINANGVEEPAPGPSKK